MKKILIVCTTDSMIWNFLVPHIYEMQKKGIAVECACSRTGFYFDELVNKDRLILHEIDFARNPFKFKNIKAFFILNALIKNNEYDCIYGHEPVGGAMARMAGKLNQKYVIYAAHGFHFFKKAPIKHWILYYSFEMFLSLFTDAMLTICNEDYKSSQSLFAKHKYMIPGIGVEFSKYNIEDEESWRNIIRKKFGFNRDDFVLITVGELSDRKNHIVILEALKKIKEENIKLLICGEGELERLLKKKVNNFGLDDNVIFCGFRRDVPYILKAADVFVFPSLWEGLGLAGIEAMYSGLPVIGANRQGIKDYVHEGKTGFLFEPTNATELAKKIRVLKRNKALRKIMSINGRKEISRYSLSSSISAVSKVFIKEGIIK